MRFIKDFKPNVVGYMLEDVPSHKTTQGVGIFQENFIIFEQFHFKQLWKSKNDILEFQVPEYVLVNVQSFHV